MSTEFRQKKYEENALILDFMPEGRSIGKRSEPIAQAMGDTFFTLLELVPKHNTVLRTLDVVYIGRGQSKRTLIDHVKRRIDFDDLTNAARQEVESTVESIVEHNSMDFLNFFNKAVPITTRLHQLELIPGIGKKYLWTIIRARRSQQFASFKDLEERIRISDPKRLIIRRVLSELQGNEKYRLFTRHPRQPSPTLNK